MNHMNTYAGDNVCDGNKNLTQVYRKWSKFKGSKLEKNFGVAFGNFNINDIENDRTAHMQLAFACCQTAFGETFITPEDRWDEAILNRILSEGRTLLNKPLDKQKIAYGTGVKSFSLSDNAMQVFVDSPDVTGQVISSQQRVLSFQPAICTVFCKRHNSSYLLRVKEMCLLIWFRNNCNYVFDGYGRDSRCERDVVNGCDVVMCLTFLKDVCYLITHQVIRLYCKDSKFCP